MSRGTINSQAMPANHLALLRGVNLGGKNKLPMKDLAVLFTAAGCSDVATFIQSGNVIFNLAPRAASKLPELIAAAIAGRFHFQTQIILRTREEIRDVILGNPFLKKGIPADTLHALFLADRPPSGAIEQLDPNRSAPDEFIVQGREIYLNLPNGVGKTKLTNSYFDSKLRTVSTGRNWRTVTKLLDLMES